MCRLKNVFLAGIAAFLVGLLTCVLAAAVETFGLDRFDDKFGSAWDNFVLVTWLAASSCGLSSLGVALGLAPFRGTARASSPQLAAAAGAAAGLLHAVAWVAGVHDALTPLPGLPSLWSSVAVILGLGVGTGVALGWAGRRRRRPRAAHEPQPAEGRP